MHVKTSYKLFYHVWITLSKDIITLKSYKFKNITTNKLYNIVVFLITSITTIQSQCDAVWREKNSPWSDALPALWPRPRWRPRMIGYVRQTSSLFGNVRGPSAISAVVRVSSLRIYSLLFNWFQIIVSTIFSFS